MNDRTKERLGNACAWAAQLSTLPAIDGRSRARYLDSLFEDDAPAPAKPTIADRLLAWYEADPIWLPNDAQIERFSAWLRRTGSIADRWLRVAVIAGAAYILLEVALAFLPGGAVDRVIGGR